jgi:hypothetical protein
MQSSSRIIMQLAALSAGWIANLSAEAMPAAQQNALVHKYCAVCHTDAARNGGLSLQHFDVVHASPSLAAMLLSKLKTGAMGASGLPTPDKTTVAGLMDALAAESAGAHEWSLDHVTNTPTITASILREWPATGKNAEPSLYRLVLACNPETRAGEMQLAWAPMSMRGVLSVAADGNAPKTYQVEGVENMGNGMKGTSGPAAVTLQTAKDGTLALPARSLKIAGLFPNQSVEFPFTNLPDSARQAVSPCFR